MFVMPAPCLPGSARRSRGEGLRRLTKAHSWRRREGPSVSRVPSGPGGDALDSKERRSVSPQMPEGMSARFRGGG